MLYDMIVKGCDNHLEIFIFIRLLTGQGSCKCGFSALVNKIIIWIQYVIYENEMERKRNY